MLVLVELEEKRFECVGVLFVVALFHDFDIGRFRLIRLRSKSGYRGPHNGVLGLPFKQG